MELSRHAVDKLQTYGIEGLRYQDWKATLITGEVFHDLATGASGLVMLWEGRPWVVILSEDGSKVLTTYPTDEQTVNNRRGGGRWNFLSN